MINIAATTAIPSRRTLFSSATVRSTAVALLCAFGLHLAFPLTTWWWLAPFAAAGLVAAWCALPPRAAALVGPAAPLLDLGPAVVEALAFAFAAVVASLAARRCDARAVPFVAAAAFALAEQIRSTSSLGVPLEQLGITMIDSPLRALAAYAGGYGLTFTTMLLGASLGWWLLSRSDARRLSTMIAVWVGVLLCTSAAWLFWPARHYAVPVRRVAAVQGGIAQSVKRSDAGFALALDRYTTMTKALRAQHPALVLWPETVITTDVL